MPFYLRTQTSRKEIVEVAMGRLKADTVLQNARIVNVYTSEIIEGGVSIKGDRIACVGNVEHTLGRDTKVIDLHSEYVVPGLLDGHIHPESTMLTLTELAKALVPHGTAGILADMHEITNVLGIRGLRLFIKEASTLPIKVFIAVPSSVPMCSRKVEVPASCMDINDVKQILDMDSAVSLGELLNVREVIDGGASVYKKIEAAISKRRSIDGNAPGLMGKELAAYIAAGAQHDHEAVNVGEGLERLRHGMWLMFREGSSERNMEELTRILKETEVDSRHCCFATDDKDARDLTLEGHIDHCIRKAVSTGVDPIVALQMATLNCAEYMEVDREMGAIAPGKIAGIIVVKDLSEFKPSKVFLNGRLVAEEGRCLIEFPKCKYPNWALHTFKIASSIEATDLSIRSSKSHATKIRVIDVSEGCILSGESIDEINVLNGELKSDTNKDLLKLCVVHRHAKTPSRRIGKGFIKGLGLKRGALASSVAHDTHNIISVGASDQDMATAMNAIIKMDGGLTIVSDGNVIASQQLRLGGIVALEGIEKVVDNLTNLELSARELGCKIDRPFMVLSFQSSASIPKLKLSTRGLIDVESMRIVPLEIN